MARNKITLKCGPSRTKQSDAASCDINNIVASIRKNGFQPMSLPAMKGAFYGDVSAAQMSYQDAQNMVLNVQTVFSSLPAEIREKFGNNPAKLVEFVENPANEAEAVKMGLTPDPKAKLVPAVNTAQETAVPEPSGSSPQEAGK